MKVALLGYGIEGESAYNYYSKRFPGATFVVYDQHTTPKQPLPEGVSYEGGVENFHDIDADVVIKTPAIPPNQVRSRGVVTSVTKEFFAECPAPIIGVTGTKGKGTTCSLIAEILKAAGKTVWLVGNIGVPALDVLDKIGPHDIVVYELSSFQLWDLDKSPQVAVVLGIEPEHLDVHVNFDEYVKAKSHITRFQGSEDVVIYFDNNETSKQLAYMSPGRKQGYHVEEGENISIDGRVFCKKSEVGLLGKHNLENVYAALLAVWQFTQDEAAIRTGLQSFKGLPHRLELVREVAGAAYYDDSFSSAPASTKVAIQAFNQPIVLIAGGFDRGLDYTDLGKAIEESAVKKVILLGQTKEKIAEKLQTSGYELADSLEQAVAMAKSIAQAGDVVLLSPGCASFDSFRNFSERGDKFKELVNNL